MISNKVVFKDKKPIRSLQQLMKISRVPDCYWSLINNCWKQNPDKRLIFEQISELLKDDIQYENRHLKIHKYQKRIDIEIENILLEKPSKFIGKKNFIWTRQ